MEGSKLHLGLCLPGVAVLGEAWAGKCFKEVISPTWVLLAKGEACRKQNKAPWFCKFFSQDIKVHPHCRRQHSADIHTSMGASSSPARNSQVLILAPAPTSCGALGKLLPFCTSVSPSVNGDHSQPPPNTQMLQDGKLFVNVLYSKYHHCYC